MSFFKTRFECFFFHKSTLKIFNIDNEHNIYIKFNVKRKSLNIDVEIVFTIHILYYSKIIKIVLQNNVNDYKRFVLKFVTSYNSMNIYLSTNVKIYLIINVFY